MVSRKTTTYPSRKGWAALMGKRIEKKGEHPERETMAERPDETPEKKDRETLGKQADQRKRKPEKEGR